MLSKDRERLDEIAEYAVEALSWVRATSFVGQTSVANALERIVALAAARPQSPEGT
jgi:hypothetical protein